MKFEEALQKLEEIVEQLERGNLPLDKSLEIFEEGIKLSRLCTKQLEEAEQRVELVLGIKDGKPEMAPFQVKEVLTEDDETQN
ncbi:MAG: exodeoxyribonuclease VII small subunit [Nitrospira sp.]|nr:exodeoxyribonuclease VII small subunit [Nitrospira sp.]